MAGAQIRSRRHDSEAKTIKSAQHPILNSTEAHLFVADIKTSCDFYSGKLGFTVAFVYGDPPFYGQVTRDQARLNLRVVGEPVLPATFASASIWCALRSRSLPRTKSNSFF